MLYIFVYFLKLCLANCPPVDVLHINHWEDGNTGEYFYFSDAEFSRMVGYDDWNSDTFDVLQKGSHHWSGKIVVWKGTSSNYGPHGRRDSARNEGQWVTSDTIQLEHCSSGT